MIQQETHSARPKQSISRLLARRLRLARSPRTQREVERRLGISQPVLSKMEQGRREPTALELKRLADYYRKPLNFFFLPDETPSHKFTKKKDETITSGPLRVLTEAEIQQIADRVVVQFNPQRVMLFGSYAWGEPRPTSDVDLLVVTDDLISLRPAQRRFQVKKSCQPPLVPMDVIVVSPDELSEKMSSKDLFLQKIIREGKVLYEQSSH